MKKYVPIVTDDPKGNVEAALNLVFVKNSEVYVLSLRHISRKR